MVIKKKLLILFCLAICICTDAESQELEFASFRIGVTPAAFFNTFPAVQVSIDKAIAEETNIELELGYIYRSVGDARGFRIRTGIEQLVAISESKGFAVGLLFNYRRSVEYRNVRRRDASGEFNRIFYNNRRVRQLAGVIASCKIIKKPKTRGTYEIGAGLGPGTYHIFEDIPVLEGDVLDGDRELINPNLRTNLITLEYFHLPFSYILEE